MRLTDAADQVPIEALRSDALRHAVALLKQLEAVTADLDPHLRDTGARAEVVEVLCGGRRAVDAVILAARRVCDRLGCDEATSSDATGIDHRQEP